MGPSVLIRQVRLTLCKPFTASISAQLNNQVISFPPFSDHVLSQGYLLISSRRRRQKYIFFNGLCFKPCVFPSFSCHIFSTKSWLFSITECFDFCFSMPISLNCIILWYIFRFFDWKSNKSLSAGQCFSHPGMTVTWSTPPVTQRKEQENSSQIFTCVPRRHRTGTYQTLFHHNVGIASIKMKYFFLPLFHFYVYYY